MAAHPRLGYAQDERFVGGAVRPATSRPAARRGAASFAINGRFLTQSVTGVQRYAREVTRELDRLLGARGDTATMLVPRLPDAPPAFEAIIAREFGPLQGHLWEQVVLPAREAPPLLNLCNTAPLVGRRSSLCIHDTNVFSTPESYGWRFRAFYKALQPLLVRRAARLTTVSKHAAGEIARVFGIRARDIDVLPNGHEHTHRWNPAASALASGQPIDRPFVLLIGSLARHKNIAVVLRLADQLDALGCDIRIVGTPAGIFADTTRRQAANLRWLGRVSDDDLAFLLSRALCLAFPSLSEGFGLPVLEAMARGCPVVASRASCLPEICGPDALLADPHDPQQWLEHVQALMRSRQLREEQQDRGLEQARRFSWAASALGYDDLMSRN